MISLGKYAGIEVRAHQSSLLVFGGVALAFAVLYLPDVTPAASLPERLAVGAAVSALLALSVACHEYAHAFVARARGRSVGVLTLYLFGGSANVDDRGMRADDEVAIGAAGPLASGALALVFVGAGLYVLRSSEPAGDLILNIGLANALLAIFNALPGFPMDGGRILRGLLWRASGNGVWATKRASGVGRFIAYCIVALGALLISVNEIAGGIWIAATGWLLASLAKSYYRVMLLRIALDGLTARDLCARDIPVLQTSDSIAAAASRFGAGAGTRTLPVLFGERVAGVVSDVQVAGMAAERAAQTQVASVMTRAYDLPSLSPDADASAIPVLLATAPIQAAIVEADGTYIGLVRREDIDRYVEMVEDLGNSLAARRVRKTIGASRTIESGRDVRATS